MLQNVRIKIRHFEADCKPKEVFFAKKTIVFRIRLLFIKKKRSVCVKNIAYENKIW